MTKKNVQYSLPLPQGKFCIGNYLVKYNRVKSDWVRNSRVIYDPVRNKLVEMNGSEMIV